jgi:uncharacterized protein (TIGR00645 family)
MTEGSPNDVSERVKLGLGRAMFATRWIMAPIYLGMLLSLCLVAVKFAQTLFTAMPGVLTMSSNETILTVLTLVDLLLLGNLVVIVMFAGWESFLGRVLRPHTDDQRDWLGSLDFSAVKLKLIASIVAIAAIQLLETFVHIDEVPKIDAMWQLAILVGIAVTGVLLALMDRLAGPH